MSADQPHLVIAGAGAIGCFVGSLLQRGGALVTYLGRPRILDEIAKHGLRLTDFSGLDAAIDPGQLTTTTDPRCLAQADIVLVAVKSGATQSIAEDIAEHAPHNVTIVSLQNGLDNVKTLRKSCPDHDVRAGMVPFNVVPKGRGHFHRATSGNIVIEAGQGDLATSLSVPDLMVETSDRIEAIQWGKFLLNLNNAPNALSGLTLQEQLLNRDWRRLMADQMQEALRVLKAHGIAVKPTTPVPAGVIPYVLRLPTPLFRKVAASMLTIDPEARTSMAHDLQAGRATEIDALQGKVIEMAVALGQDAPIAARILKAIKRAELTGYAPVAVKSLR